MPPRGKVTWSQPQPAKKRNYPHYKMRILPPEDTDIELVIGELYTNVASLKPIRRDNVNSKIPLLQKAFSSEMPLLQKEEVFIYTGPQRFTVEMSNANNMVHVVHTFFGTILFGIVDFSLIKKL